MFTTQCVACRHYRGQLRCAAFEQRIPEDILTGRVSHSKPYPGDGGIQYEPGDSGLRYEPSRS